MTAPSDYPDFATDDDFTNGPDVGTATKVEPSAGELAEGYVPGTATPAQKMNWWMNLVGLWVRHLDGLKGYAQIVPAITDLVQNDTLPIAGHFLSGGYSVSGNGIVVPRVGAYAVTLAFSATAAASGTSNIQYSCRVGTVGDAGESTTYGHVRSVRAADGLPARVNGTFIVKVTDLDDKIWFRHETSTTVSVQLLSDPELFHRIVVRYVGNA